MKSILNSLGLLLLFVFSSCAVPELEPTPTKTQTKTPTAPISSEFTLTPSQTPISISNPDKISTPSIIEKEGWQNYLDQENGFAILLPQTWIYLDLGVQDFDAMLSSVEETNPVLEGIYTPEFLKNLAVAGCRLIALDTSAEIASSWSTLNIAILFFPMDMSFEDYLEFNVSHLEDLAGGNITITQEIIYLREIEAGKLVYQSPLLESDKAIMYQQYLVLDGHTQYILTFTSEMNSYDFNEPLFMEIAQGFRLIR